jgi:hypothetical protein
MIISEKIQQPSEQKSAFEDAEMNEELKVNSQDKSIDGI